MTVSVLKNLDNFSKITSTFFPVFQGGPVKKNGNLNVLFYLVHLLKGGTPFCASGDRVQITNPHNITKPGAVGSHCCIQALNGGKNHLSKLIMQKWINL
jgi:hypothetical protein